MKLRLLPLLAALLLLCSCGAAAPSAQLDFFSMDTFMSFTVYAGDRTSAEAAAEEAKAAVLEDESLFSRTREGSDIYTLNQTGACSLSPETARLLELAEEYRALTGGAFDVTIGAVMDAWGFTTGSYRVPEPQELEALLRLTGPEMLKLDGSNAALGAEGVVVDLGGIGKGWAADSAVAALRENCIDSAILSLGGNVAAVGLRPDGEKWSVAIRDPEDAGGYAGILRLEDEFAVTTGGYERCFTEGGITYHHVIDPSTGYPADSGVVSATVICGSSAKADILSTALFIVGEERAEELYMSIGGFEYVLLTDDGRAIVSPGAEYAPQ